MQRGRCPGGLNKHRAGVLWGAMMEGKKRSQEGYDGTIGKGAEAPIAHAVCAPRSI